jgi:hypothetical protein
VSGPDGGGETASPRIFSQLQLSACHCGDCLLYELQALQRRRQTSKRTVLRAKVPTQDATVWVRDNATPFPRRESFNIENHRDRGFWHRDRIVTRKPKRRWRRKGRDGTPYTEL